MINAHVSVTLTLDTEVDETEDWSDVCQMLVQECRTHGTITNYNVPTPEGYELAVVNRHLTLRKAS